MFSGFWSGYSFLREAANTYLHLLILSFTAQSSKVIVTIYNYESKILFISVIVSMNLCYAITTYIKIIWNKLKQHLDRKYLDYKMHIGTTNYTSSEFTFLSKYINKKNKQYAHWIPIPTYTLDTCIYICVCIHTCCMHMCWHIHIYRHTHTYINTHLIILPWFVPPSHVACVLKR